MNLLPRLQHAIATTLRIPEHSISIETVNEDLPAWDSLGHVNLMMALEQAFDIYVEVEDFERLTSVRAMLEYLDAKGVR
ncbi:MAG: acyl carrier protein [Betaproteobacteria bacterium]|jgi:acyl carrier protein|nr:acyl carrier protein [Betaproteobacteria bacterium]